MIKESIKKSYEICKNSPSLIALLVGFYVIFGYIGWWNTTANPTNSKDVLIWIFIGLLFLFYLYMHIGVLTYFKNKIEGTEATIKTVLKSNFKNILSVFFFYLCCLVLIISSATLFSLIFIFPEHYIPTIIKVGIIILGLFVTMLVLSIITFFVPTIIVAENVGPFPAIKKSYQALKNYPGPFFGVIGLNILLTCLTLIVNYVTNPANNFSLIGYTVSLFVGLILEIFLSCLMVYIYLKFFKTPVTEVERP